MIPSGNTEFEFEHVIIWLKRQLHSQAGAGEEL